MSLDQRPRGILSEADRRYLTNPDEYSKQARYERRQAIIERLHESLHDMPLLVSKLDGGSRARGFEDRDLDQRDHTLNILPSSFALLYLGITDTVEPSDLAKDAFEDMVASGVRRAYLEREEPVAEVEVFIDVTKADETKPLDEMTLSELQQLGKLGKVSREEFIEQLADQIQFGDGEASLSPPEEVEKSRAEWLADLLGFENDDE